jgi:hypothetical protein
LWDLGQWHSLLVQFQNLKEIFLENFNFELLLKTGNALFVDGILTFLFGVFLYMMIFDNLGAMVLDDASVDGLLYK